MDRSNEKTFPTEPYSWPLEESRQPEHQNLMKRLKKKMQSMSAEELQEAEAFLKVVAPRQMEIDQAKSQAAKVHKSLKSLCTEYRLVQTTSNPKACDDPSRALITEFARLLKRKSDLLSSGEADKKEYYEKWIPPRWNKLSRAETNACGTLVEFVDELEAKGIDRSALESQLSSVRTCFSAQGSIE